MVQYINIITRLYLCAFSGAHYVATVHQLHTALDNENEHYFRHYARDR